MFFRNKKSRQPPPDPIPDWDDTRWRSHLRATALGTEHHCNIYVEMINADRKEAARLFKNGDETRARSFASSAIRNKKTVTALGALAPICNSLYQRPEPLAGYTTIEQIPDPARAAIVTIVFAASRLQMSYLTDIVHFLQEQFGNAHIARIQKPVGELEALINDTVRAALSNTTAPAHEVDSEIVSAVKEYFGVSATPNQAAWPYSATPPTHYSSPPQSVPSQTDLPRAHQVAPSINSSDAQPLSPQLSHQSKPGAGVAVVEERMAERGRMYVAPNAPPQYPPPNTAQQYSPQDVTLPASVEAAALEHASSPQQSSEHDPFVGTTEDEEMEQMREMEEQRPMPPHLANFDDSDQMLLKRYEHLRVAIAV